MNLNIDMNMLRELDGIGIDETDARRRIAQYLYRLTEELRYVIDNLEPENFSAEMLEKWNGMREDLEERVLKLDPGDEYTVTATNKSMADLQAWVDGHGKMLTKALTINIKAEMNGHLYLRGFKNMTGNGRIAVNFIDSGRLHGSIRAYDCDEVRITGRGTATSPDIQPDDGQYGVYARCVRYLYMPNVVVNMKESSYTGSKMNVSVNCGTHLYMDGCCLLGGSYGAYVNICSMASIYNCTGGQGTGNYVFSQQAIRAIYGTHVWVGGTKRPKGSTGGGGGYTLDIVSGAVETAGLADNAVIPY